MDLRITMTPRNLILIICLALFLTWYVADWAYKTQYREPRLRLGGEITKLSGEITVVKNNIDGMTQFSTQSRGYYYRSLPRNQNDARSLYPFWLYELLQYSGLEDNHVTPHSPARLSFGADYRFTIQCTGTLSQLSYFLFEFYYAPFLHRIEVITLNPVDGNAERVSCSMTVSALQLFQYQVNDPYPMMNQLPTGMFPRLPTNDLGWYQTIANRNLLQTAKGGIDRADFAVLTGMPIVGNQQEVWFSIRTDDTSVKKRLGDSIQIGSFSGKIVEILDQDIVLERNGERWLLTAGESLNEAFALPPETATK